MRLFFLFSFVLILFSCKKVELNTISKSLWNPNLALPLAYGNFTISDILKQADSVDKYMQTKPSLQLIVKESIKGFTIDQALKIPDINAIPPTSVLNFSDPGNKSVLDSINSISTKLPGSRGDLVPIINYGSKVVPATQPIKQELSLLNNSNPGFIDTTEIDEINFSDGEIKVDILSDIQHKIELVYEITEMSKDGKPLTGTIVCDKSTTTPSVIKLAGVKASLKTKKFTFIIKNIFLTIGSYKITTNDKISVGISMTGIKFESIFGYFGKIKVDPPIVDTLKLDQLSDLKDKGEFGMTNPSLKFTIKNGFGIPVNLNINRFDIKHTDQTYSISSPISYDIKYPINSSQQAVLDTNVKLDNDNIPNFDKLLSSKTEQIIFGAGVNINKNGPSDVRNFISSNSSISLDAEVRVPLTGYAKNFTFEDTSDISLPFDLLKSLSLIMLYKNSLPVEISGSIRFLDKQGNLIKDNQNNVIDLLASSSNKIFESPNMTKIDNNGGYYMDENDVKNIDQKKVEIKITSNQIPFLLNATKVIFKGKFNTFQHPSNTALNKDTPITLYDYYGLSIKLLGDAKGKVPF